MKKIVSNTNNILTGSLFAALSFVSCKKLIEIPANPPSSITQQQVFTDSATAMSAVAGVYTYNAGNGFAYSDGALTYSAGLSSDELSYVQSSDNQQFYSYTLTPLNSGVSTLWSYAYQSIYQVNDVLKGITNNPGLSAAFQQQITGEMKVVRALYYFNLVNLFGDVPLVLTTDYSESSRLPRTPVADVYSQIKADLADARNNLPATYPSAGRARPNLYTVMALQAKVNLYLGNWQSAYNEADSIIRFGNYQLEPAPGNVFLDGSTEAIWQLPAQKQNYAVADAQNFIPYNSVVSPNYLITPFLLNAFEAGDQRLQKWTASRVISGKTLYYPYKYKNVRPNVSPIEDQMIVRLGEIYLIRAEAAAQLKNLTQALADVNAIRARAGLTGSTANPTSQSEILNAIMHERQVELFCEWGNRWYDLKRTGNAATLLGAEKTGYTTNAGLYPIPQTQRQLNTLLSQNPGY